MHKFHPIYRVGRLSALFSLNDGIGGAPQMTEPRSISATPRPSLLAQAAVSRPAGVTIASPTVLSTCKLHAYTYN